MTDKTPMKTYGPWCCAVCGDSDGISGGITKQLSNTKAFAGRCHWCDQSGVLVKRVAGPILDVPTANLQPNTKP